MDNNFNKIVYLNDRIKGSYNSDISKIDSYKNGSNLDPIWNIQQNTKPRFESFSPYKEETVYHTMSDGTKQVMFENYIAGVDNEQRLAEQQSASEKWANGATKFLAKTGTAVLGGTVGVVNDLIVGVKEGSISAAYNSNFNKWLDDLNTKLDYNLPNYYTQQEKQAGFGSSLGSANFWANDFLGGLSFTAGAIVSEGIWAYATGGTSLLAEGSLGLSRLGTKALTKAELKTAGIAGKSEAVRPVIDAVGTAINAPITTGQALAATRQTNLVKAMDALRFTATSAGYESSMEARQYIKTTEDAWLRKFETENGRTPDSNEYLKFKTNLTDAANSVFAANMVLVGSSNMATFGKLALGKTIKPDLPNSWFSRNLLGVGFKEGAERGSLEAIKATAGQKAFGKVYGIAKLGITEGIYEEGGQRVASESAKAYMLNGYDKNGLRTSYGMQEALYEGLSSTYGSKEGWKEVGLGILIGVFGGGISQVLSGQGLKNVFDEAATDRVNVQQAVDYYNEFHVGNLIDAQKANSRIYQAIEKSEQANNRGDVVGQIQADREIMLATLDRQYNLGGIDFSINQYETAMNATPINDLSKELGVSVEEAEQWKTQRIEEYKNLANDYEAYSNFTNSLLGDVKIAGLSAEDRNSLGKAITFNMVMGKYALEDSQNITDTLKRFVATDLTTSKSVTDAIDTDFALEQAGSQAEQSYRKLNKKSRYLERRQQELIKRTTEIQNYTVREDSTEKTQALNKNTQQLLEVEEQLREVQAQKQILADTINLKNISGKLITVEMLDNQSQNVLKLGESIANLKQIDPQKSAIVEKLVQEQTRAIRNAKGYNATTQQIQDPSTRYTLLNGWLSSLIKSRNNKPTEADYFVETMNNYRESLGELQSLTQEQKEDNKAYVAFKNGEKISNEYLQKLNSEINKGNELTIQQQEIYDANRLRAEELNVDEATMPETPSRPTQTQLQKLEEKARDILNKNLYTLQYTGEDILGAEEPTQEDLNKFQEYQSKDSLNEQEANDFIQLRQKLSDWKILDGAVDENDSSITDLLRIIHALKQNVSKIETKVDYTPVDYSLLNNEPAEIEAGLSATSNRTSTPDNVLTVLTEKNGIRKQNFSYISIEGFSRFYPTASLYIETSKGQELYDPNKHKKSAKKQGTNFVLKEGENEVKIQIGERSRLVVEENSLNNIPNTMSILRLGVKDQNMVFETLSNGDAVMVDSDFSFSDTSGNLLSVGVNTLNSKKPGDIVEFRVDKEDSYNAQLLSDYEKNREKDPEKALNDLENNLSIYIFGESSDELLGNLGAMSEKGALNSSSQKNKEMRKEITQRVLASDDRVVLTGQSAKVNIVLLGSPNLKAELDEQGNIRPSTTPFTQESVSLVRTTGYMQGEQTSMSKEIKGVNMTYVKAVAKHNPTLKIPFAVLEYEGKNIAYPIQMNIEAAPRDQDLNRIMDSKTSPDTKALQVVELMQNTGISPDRYNINFANPDWITSEELNLLSKELAQNTAFVTADDLANNFDKNRLIDVAQISVDPSNNPFRAGKMMLDLNEVNYTRPSSLDVQTDLEGSLSRDAIEIDRLVRSDAFADISDIPFTDAFDDAEIIKNPKRHVDNLTNMNILKKAFSEKLPNKIIKLIGQDKINEIKRKIVKQQAQVKITAELKKQADEAKKCN